MQFNLADVFELAVDQYADRDYIVTSKARCTYREMDERANRLAHYLSSQGIGKNDHVGIYAHNCIEWVETLWAVFKIRAVWVNINYRYIESELAYIFDNADLKALVFQQRFAPQVHGVIDSMPLLKQLIVINDESGIPELDAVELTPYEYAMEQGSPVRDFGKRSESDFYMLYTGGTTGMPKGVMWHHKDAFYAFGGGIHPTTGEIAQHPQEVIDRGQDFPLSTLPAAPLMHGASQFALIAGSYEGRKIVLQEKFDAPSIWQWVEDEKINGILVTGDAMARPLIEAFQNAENKTDTSSLFILVSSAAVLSQSIKDQILTYFPDLLILDAMGSSETGTTGVLSVDKENTSMKGGPTINPTPGSVVLDAKTFEPLQAGVVQTGLLATSGFIPLGYYKDEEKTASTFVTSKNGTRYALTGDMAMLESDGRITVLGRGSVCINSGGEKIFPEEVESAIKSHPNIYDVTVVGATDSYWGNVVAAIVQPRAAKTVTLDAINQHCKSLIASYKYPKQLHIVNALVRSPSGKPDYQWAKKIVASEQYKVE